jgi:hypothetical protein
MAPLTPPTLAERLRLHAEHLTQIPPDVEHLPHLQAVLSVALADLAKWFATDEYKRQS